MLTVGFTALRRLLLLRLGGLSTQAIVFDRWWDKDSDGGSTFFIAIAYQVPFAQGGLKVITYAEQSKVLYDKHQIGDALTVRYLPDNPSICQLPKV